MMHSRQRAAARRSFLLLISFLILFGAGGTARARKNDAAAARCALSIPSIYERVSPAVVYISATSINPYQMSGRVERAVGSGFIIDPGGLILTNSHVAFPRQSLVVTLNDGTSLPARLVGADPIFDVALLSIAVPSNLVKAPLPSLVKEGHVARPWLGFHGQFIDGELQNIFRIDLVPGFLVEVVEPGSPAERAGLQGGDLEINIAGHEFLLGGDIITAINGAAVSSPEKVVEALRGMKVGAPVALTVFREGKELKLAYDLPERPILPGDIDGPGASYTLRGAVRPLASPRAVRQWRRIIR
jgi:S1-C subfamily serine protease